MPNFTYKAKKKDAETVLGEMIASDKEDAIERIMQLDLVPISVDEGAISTKKRSGFVRLRKVRQGELYFFSRQLVNMLKAGVSILRALEIIMEQTNNAYFKAMLGNIHFWIKGGRTFSECLADYPHVFSSLYVSMVRAGEESGKLREYINDVSEHIKRQNEIMSKVKTAATYPALMSIFGLGTIFFILTFVMPQITELFVNVNQALPGPTVFIMCVSGFLIKYWTWVALIFVICLAATRKWVRTEYGHRSVSKIKLSIPILGDFLLKVEISRFCRTLGLLLRSGMPIIQSLQLAIPVVHNGLVRDDLAKCREDLLAGSSLSASLSEAKYIPAMVIQLIVVGEESGSLSQTLEDISENYEQEINDRIKVLITLLEPIMIVVVGGVIGFIIIAMLLPIFQLDIFA